MTLLSLRLFPVPVLRMTIPMQTTWAAATGPGRAKKQVAADFFRAFGALASSCTYHYRISAHWQPVRLAAYLLCPTCYL